MSFPEKIAKLFFSLWQSICSFFEKRIKPFFTAFSDGFEKIQIKVFHKGKLKHQVLIRYLIKELTLYFLVAFAFFFFIFFCNQILLVAESILKKHVPLKQVLKLMWYSLPQIMAQSSPMATLVGFLMCLGRMMSDNEILILRASGQGYRIVVIPVILLGLLISIVSFFINDYLLPVGNIKYQKMISEIARSNPGVIIEPNTIKRLKNATIIIGDVKDNEVSDLVIFDRGSDNKQRVIVSGKANTVSAKDAGILMQLNMNDTVVMFMDVRDRSKFDILDSDSTTLNIFDSAIISSSSVTSPSQMTSFDVHRLIKNLKSKKNYSKQQLNRYEMEYHKKFSLPMAAVFFAFLALPLAFLFGKHNGQTIGLIIGIIICVWFWAMQVLGQIFSSRNGMNGIFAMWLPDIIIFGVAGLLYLVLKRK